MPILPIRNRPRGQHRSDQRGPARPIRNITAALVSASLFASGLADAGERPPPETGPGSPAAWLESGSAHLASADAVVNILKQMHTDLLKLDFQSRTAAPAAGSDARDPDPRVSAQPSAIDQGFDPSLTPAFRAAVGELVDADIAGSRLALAVGDRAAPAPAARTGWSPGEHRAAAREQREDAIDDRIRALRADDPAARTAHHAAARGHSREAAAHGAEADLWGRAGHQVLMRGHAAKKKAAGPAPAPRRNQGHER